jgi:hypothetical protein
MVQRSDAPVQIDVSPLRDVKMKQVFSGEFYSDRRTAEIRALDYRLQGRPAYVQNGLEGNYEVVISERQPEIRVYTASTFKEIGCGVYQATNPDWDTHSVWSLYQVEKDGSILLSRVDEDDIKSAALTDKLMVASSVRGQKRVATSLYSIGETLQYVDTTGAIVTGTIIDVDRAADAFIVRNSATLQRDYISMSRVADTAESQALGLDDIQTKDDLGSELYTDAEELHDELLSEFPELHTASEKDEAIEGDPGQPDFYSEDASADDELEYEVDPHSEEAYTSEDPSADDTYDQQPTDVTGTEGVENFDEITPADVREALKKAMSECGDAGWTDSGDCSPSGDDDYEQVPADLQSEQGAEDVTYTDADDINDGWM